MAAFLDAAVERLQVAITRDVPAYLKGLPLPKTAQGFLGLDTGDWVKLAPLLGTLIVVHLLSVFALSQLLGVIAAKGGANQVQINHNIKKTLAKVVDYVPEKREDKTAYCRCWKSKTFPHCDGSHNAHNKESGDNIGPLMVPKS
ncbi:Fe2-S2 domain containing protein [Klebsormidium nitens]|uniref:Fe2-S2 domain containing protein n=1 Tax=Klebsormidium nitens TaxID=105231 RepID=A0A1Y1I8K3_KLENI|nr:Fe2-S2 domain containing protein [Klebsormidium nitens]|eukprot:GAQ84428.1 Fe2-S2 domain containing protein [Klebsormidium nitens]